MTNSVAGKHVRFLELVVVHFPRAHHQGHALQIDLIDPLGACPLPRISGEATLPWALTSMTSMLSSAVFKIQRTDAANGECDYVLLRCETTHGTNLDLKLVATDARSVFTQDVPHKLLPNLRSKANKGTPDEWATIIRAILLQDAQALADPIAQHVGLAAAVGEDTINIFIRRNVDGITQRLGELALRINAQEEVDFIQWAADSAQRSAQVQTQAIQLQDRVRELEQANKNLKEKAQSIGVSHDKSRSELLDKFADVLNTKKIKIREQQRLLLSKGQIFGNDDQDTIEPRAKRKAREVDAEISEDEGHGSDATMRTTSDEAAGEGEDEDEQTAAIPGSGNPSSQSKQSESTNARAVKAKIPPKRQLPFGRSFGGTSQQSNGLGKEHEKANENDDDETDDDEL